MNELRNRDRFVTLRTVLPRPVQDNGLLRRVYFAFDTQSGDLRLAAFVVVSECGYGNYVEWMHVHKDMRRNGVATEILRSIEERAAELTVTGTTFEGERFAEAYLSQFPRRKVIDEYLSSVMLEADEHLVFKTQCEDPGHCCDVVQVYTFIEESNGPDCVIVLDRSQHGRVLSIYNDAIDLENDRPEWMDAIENEYGKLDLSNSKVYV